MIRALERGIRWLADGGRSPNGQHTCATNDSSAAKYACYCNNGCFSPPYWPELEPLLLLQLVQVCHASSAEQVQEECSRSLANWSSRAADTLTRAYGSYDLESRVRNISYYEGGFRGVPWFETLSLATRLASAHLLPCVPPNLR